MYKYCKHSFTMKFNVILIKSYYMQKLQTNLMLNQISKETRTKRIIVDSNSNASICQ